MSYWSSLVGGLKRLDHKLLSGPTWTQLYWGICTISLWYKPQLSRQWNCWSLRCSWSIACRRCSNYIVILNLTHGFNRLGKDSCKSRRETSVFGDWVRLILEIWRYIIYPINILRPGKNGRYFSKDILSAGSWLLNFKWSFTEIWSWVSNWKYDRIILDNVGMKYWRIYGSLGNALIKRAYICCALCHCNDIGRPSCMRLVTYIINTNNKPTSLDLIFLSYSFKCFIACVFSC